MLRLPNRSTMASYLLLAFLLVEIIRMETVGDGFLHHLVDAATIAAFAFASASIAGSIHASWMLIFLAGVPWFLDLFHIPSTDFNIESFFWCLAHFYLSLLIARKLLQIDRVFRKEIIDSISLYLASGIAFANLYSVVLWTFPTALTQGAAHVGEPIGYGLVLYYSFVTQATLGYGDIVPAHQLTRAISIFQSLFGVMFTAIVIARLIAIHAESSQKRRDREVSEER